MPITVELDGDRLHHACPCGGTAFTVYSPLRFRTCDVARCDSCGQLRTVPEPTLEDVARIYSQESNKYAFDAGVDEQRTGLWEGYAGGILGWIEEVSGGRGRMLDVGADKGDLLRVARDTGWEADGLEINAGNVERLRTMGFRLYELPIEHAEIPDGTYDAVVLNQVLEHLHDPVSALRAVRRTLKPRGLLFVGVPCFSSPIPLVLKRAEWYALLPEEHVWQFGPRTVRALLRKSGFAIVDRRRGCSHFWGRLRPSPRDILRWTVYRSLAATRQGDFLNVIARPA